MSTDGRTARTPSRETLSDPAYQAFLVLRTVFTVAPIVFGLDKSPTSSPTGPPTWPPGSTTSASSKSSPASQSP